MSLTDTCSDINGLRHLIKDGAHRQIMPALDELLAQFLENDGDRYSDDELQSVLADLMDCRYFEEAERLLEGMAVAGRTWPVNNVARAQILIEADRFSAASVMLDHLALMHSDNPALFSEAKGLAGRTRKELFLRALPGNRKAAQVHFTEATRLYNEGRAGDPEKRAWLTSNLLALRSKGAHEGMQLDRWFDAEAASSQLEAAIERIPEGERSFFDWSSQAEARFSRGDWTGAVKSVNRMLHAPDDEVFKLTSTLRQFKEMWHLQEAAPEAELIISAIERKLLQKPNGRVVMDRNDIARQRSVREEQLEAMFGDALMRGQSWMERLLAMGSSVAVVVDRHTGRVRGTCCLVNGGDFDASLDGRLLCLTNDHVVSEYPESYALSRPLAPADATVRFTLSDEPKREYEIAKVVWSSPFEAHDSCLFELKEAPPFARSKLEPVRRLPPAPADPAADIFVISHPNSDEPSYSFQNTSLLMHDAEVRSDKTLEPGYLQYTTGTVKGSSGGVALNGRLGMIGLHHAGGSEMRRLDGQSGTHEANEAVWITAIINAVRHDLAAQRPRWTATARERTISSSPGLS